MPEKGVIFGDTAAKQIVKTVREVARRTVNEMPQRARWQGKKGGSSGSVRDAIVRTSHGCGVYTVEFGKLQDVSESTSGSGANCNPCDDGSGSGSGCELILSPPPQRVVGNGKFQVVFDPQSITIPLAMNTDCVVGKVTGGAEGVTPWRVLRGYQEHIVQYRERWDCCAPDGPPVLIGKTPIVLVGKECAEIICGECPPSSGSA